MKLSDYKATAARHIAVYGAPKTGKTELVGALAAHGFKLWWFDLEAGIKTLLRPDSKAASGLDNITLFPIPDKTTYPIALSTLLKVVKGGTCEICHEHGAVGCPICKKAGKGFTSINTNEFNNKDVLVIDSYTQLMNSTMNWIMKDEIQKENFDAKAGWDEYGKQGRIGERFGSTFQSAPYNVVVISHEVLADMEDGTKKIVPVGGTKNASTEFAKYFDDVVYTDITNGKFRANSIPMPGMGKVTVGSRTGKKLVNDKGEQLGLVELFQ